MCEKRVEVSMRPSAKSVAVHEGTAASTAAVEGAWLRGSRTLESLRL